ncbi:hypothetical protein FN846DRAFT_891370 [Sphaerosporella brunnea]|uniref:Uncharacterized protein n=1 Tax=Sphaerosporella brunnea TaxID=1250544 RepID=A0A5J5ETQ0_9PEZI|nr:hypothetical protein FN846DRAFT_891370 [Sphaerosporella brunnea]
MHPLRHFLLLLHRLLRLRLPLRRLVVRTSTPFLHHRLVVQKSNPFLLPSLMLLLMVRVILLRPLVVIVLVIIKRDPGHLCLRRRRAPSTWSQFLWYLIASHMPRMISLRTMVLAKVAVLEDRHFEDGRWSAYQVGFIGERRNGGFYWRMGAFPDHPIWPPNPLGTSHSSGTPCTPQLLLVLWMSPIGSNAVLDGDNIPGTGRSRGNSGMRFFVPRPYEMIPGGLRNPQSPRSPSYLPHLRVPQTSYVLRFLLSPQLLLQYSGHRYLFHQFSFKGASCEAAERSVPNSEFLWSLVLKSAQNQQTVPIHVLGLQGSGILGAVLRALLAKRERHMVGSAVLPLGVELAEAEAKHRQPEHDPVPLPLQENDISESLSCPQSDSPVPPRQQERKIHISVGTAEGDGSVPLPLQEDDFPASLSGPQRNDPQEGDMHISRSCSEGDDPLPSPLQQNNSHLSLSVPESDCEHATLVVKADSTISEERKVSMQTVDSPGSSIPSFDPKTSILTTFDADIGPPMVVPRDWPFYLLFRQASLGLKLTAVQQGLVAYVPDIGTLLLASNNLEP